MKSTEEMIKDKIWGGLNCPDIKNEDADVIIFGIPFDEGVSFRDGTSEAPEAIRNITYTIPPSTEYFEDISSIKVKDIGDITGNNREELFNHIENLVTELVKNNQFFSMIGGDHSVTIPVLEGINKAVSEPFGIIHFDAHFDLCDTLDDDKLSHGCTARRAVEMENVGSSDNLFFVGIRSPELDELDFMSKNKINLVSGYEFDQMGVEETLVQVKDKMSKFDKVYVTIDIDVLDTFGTGTPQIGGLTTRNLLDLLKGVFELPVIGFDVVEVSPKLDSAQGSVFAGRRILTECFAHHVRKIQEFPKYW